MHCFVVGKAMFKRDFKRNLKVKLDKENIRWEWKDWGRTWFLTWFHFCGWLCLSLLSLSGGLWATSCLQWTTVSNIMLTYGGSTGASVALNLMAEEPDPAVTIVQVYSWTKSQNQTCIISIMHPFAGLLAEVLVACNSSGKMQISHYS